MYDLVAAVFEKCQGAQNYRDKGVGRLLLSVLGTFRNNFPSSVLGSQLMADKESRQHM